MHRIAYLLCEGFQVMALASQSVFEFANLVAGRPVYAVANYSVGGGSLRSSLGLVLDTEAVDAPGHADTWLVAGTLLPLDMPPGVEAVALVRRLGSQARRTAGICTGSFILAQAGLLDGRRATTHWAFAREFRELYPRVQLEEDRIFIADGNLWTSAGMTACIDMALGMVEQDLGTEIARNVAHRLVMHQRRSGGQTQHSQLLAMAPRSDRIQAVLEHVRGHLEQPLTVEALAEVAHLSPRQFSRVFSAETGESPARAIERLRLEAARLLIEQSRHSLDVVARETGFRDRRHLREAFLRGFGIPPQAVRRDARRLGDGSSGRDVATEGGV
ncbi:GlxA family transcriptional regulator [Pseudomonas mosselii]|uniref:GlxA family transcriptional regulator n=1 Tax=Pseudomonas mosselii TaxID=78327 RepID=A0AA42RRP4_9PSED|nr:GlxA family transcriptional regulator [Pseudomonas mosselii]MDH1628792.1 GlxA family transcriptional regulator [Pseudomonas mosselii]